MISPASAATWKEKGESRAVIADKARLRIKFGVLKVSNLKGGFHHGNASSLKAEMRILMLDHLVQDGRYVPDTNEDWSEYYSLDWFNVDWDQPLRGSAKPEEPMNRLKFIATQGGALSDYLSNESVELLLEGRDAYLILFYTLDAMPAFFLGHSRGVRFFGTYKVRVTIYCNETTIADQTFKVHFKAWNDFTIEKLNN